MSTAFVLSAFSVSFGRVRDLEFADLATVLQWQIADPLALQRYFGRAARQLQTTPRMNRKYDSPARAILAATAALAATDDEILLVYEGRIVSGGWGEKQMNRECHVEAS